MSHEHDHHDDADESNLRRVMIALVLTGVFMVVEVIGGIISGSLALLADAGHMLTDTMALALAAMAFHVSKRPPDGKLTFGYQRFQILAAFVNGLSLLAIVGWILIVAVDRFMHPQDVLGETMLVVAAAGEVQFQIGLDGLERLVARLIRLSDEQRGLLSLRLQRVIDRKQVPDGNRFVMVFTPV